MNGCANARVSTATADVGHGRINVFIGGLGFFLQEGNSRQHLATLAIAALGYLVIDPSLLNGMQFAFVCQALNGDDLLAGRHRHWVGARANRFAIEQHRARSALRNATSKLGAFDVEFVAQSPEQGHFWFDIERVALSVDRQFHVQSLQV
jgi:hypothetical protein